ncbi:MAG TPA: tetratricopeptide repeat protein [Thermoanaerobaculia bacterium]|nr:tetratricopeptide repeat protein [Thermoanaerobaculia bacterium]
MIRPHRALLAALTLSLALAGALSAGEEGRVLATVVDDAGAPIVGAKALVTREGTGYKLEKTTDKKGQVTLLILDATQEYQIHVEKEGYATFEEKIKPKIQDTLRVTVTLAKAVPAGPAPGSPEAAALAGADQAVLAYNAGVEALKAGNMAGAAEKFTEAAKLNPDLAEAQGVLAEVSLELGKNAEALAAANRYLELKPGDGRGLKARYDALRALGDKEQAREALAALATADPTEDTAVRLYNEGAEATRANDLDTAAVWFGRALAIDPKNPQFAKGHYVLGLTYAKAGDNAKAIEHLETFLQMAPNDAEATSAKEMLEYLKK